MIKMQFKKGDIHYIRKGPGKPYKIHICAIVDKKMVVYKYYGRHKQYWHYFVEHKMILESVIVKEHQDDPKSACKV